jgi:hypothetical protein
MRDLRKALGDVYADKKPKSEPEAPPPMSMPLDEDLARALSDALADVPSIERHVHLEQVDEMHQIDELDEIDDSPFFNLDIETEPDLEPEPEPAPELVIEIDPQDDVVLPSVARPTPKMAAWLTGSDKPGAGELEDTPDEDALPIPTQVWQLSDDDILPTRSGGGRRRSRR